MYPSSIADLRGQTVNGRLDRVKPESCSWAGKHLLSTGPFYGGRVSQTSISGRVCALKASRSPAEKLVIHPACLGALPLVRQDDGLVLPQANLLGMQPQFGSHMLQVAKPVQFLAALD
jgi:hypothetical protein